MPSPLRSSSGRMRSWLRPPTREVSTTWPTYASTCSSRSAGSSGRTGSHADESWSPERGTGHRASRNSVAPSLVTSSSSSEPSGCFRCSAWYSTPRRRPPTESAGEVGAAASTTQTSLVSRFSDQITTRSPVRRRLHLELELAVRLVQHQLVGGGGCPDPVPPDLVLPPQLVVDEVEEVRRVRRPRPAGRRPRHDVGQVPTRSQVAEPQLVDLVAVEVHRVRHQRRVRGDGPEPQFHVVGVAGELVDVEQQLVRLLVAQQRLGGVTTARTPFLPEGPCGRNSHAAAN